MLVRFAIDARDESLLVCQRSDDGTWRAARRAEIASVLQWMHRVDLWSDVDVVRCGGPRSRLQQLQPDEITTRLPDWAD